MNGCGVFRCGGGGKSVAAVDCEKLFLWIVVLSGRVLRGGTIVWCAGFCVVLLPILVLVLVAATLRWMPKAFVMTNKPICCILVRILVVKHSDSDNLVWNMES